MLAKVMSVIQLQPGEHIIRKGERASFFGIILKGTFKVIVDGSVLATLTKGALFGTLLFHMSVCSLSFQSATRTYGCR